jgi:hypothetical protein
VVRVEVALPEQALEAVVDQVVERVLERLADRLPTSGEAVPS